MNIIAMVFCFYQIAYNHIQSKLMINDLNSIYGIDEIMRQIWNHHLVYQIY